MAAYAALPTDHKRLTSAALEMIEMCRTSVGMRAAYYRQLHAIIETGRQDGTRSLINKLYSHLDRLQAHLFSPTDLRFTIEYENEYDETHQKRAQIAARLLTKDWARTGTDITFAQGVFQSLKYGSALLKQWPEQGPVKGVPIFRQSLVMPWHFGVMREDLNDLDKQPAMVETTLLDMHEVWRRIYHLPNREDLFRRIRSHAQRGQGSEDFNTYFHQVLSSSQLNTGNVGLTRPIPGGIVQLGNDPNFAIMGPDVATDLVKMHELWVQDEDDYTTIQIIEPDILLAPLLKKSNLLIPGVGSRLHPYTLIQPNEVAGYFWGRPEVVDLVEPQGLLSTWADDIKRLFGLQIDKIISFQGFDGVTDENYDQMRAAGFFNGPTGSTVTDLTPKMPPESLQMLNFVIGIIDTLGGFENILAGRGEEGVRSGAHGETLLKTASPRLRDRSLLVERQAATAADKRLRMKEAKDGRKFWTDGSTPDTMTETSFLLSDLPKDRHVHVDSHSTSPIFSDDHQNMVAFLLKGGLIDRQDALEMLPVPNRDKLQEALRKRQLAAAQQMEELRKTDPQAWGKLMAEGGGG
jgi:hypothetical protein